MKIEQKPKFQPITITIETEAEAQAIWSAVLAYESSIESRVSVQVTNDTILAISNWFSNKAQLLNG